MKLYIFFLLIVVVKFTATVDTTPLVKKSIDIKDGDQPSGYWNTKIEWKPYWVKSWIPKMVYVSIWKKIWGPVNIKEWVPLPRPPPGWKPQ